MTKKNNHQMAPTSSKGALILQKVRYTRFSTSTCSDSCTPSPCFNTRTYTNSCTPSYSNTNTSTNSCTVSPYFNTSTCTNSCTVSPCFRSNTCAAPAHLKSNSYSSSCSDTFNAPGHLRSNNNNSVHIRNGGTYVGNSGTGASCFQRNFKSDLSCVHVRNSSSMVETSSGTVNNTHPDQPMLKMQTSSHYGGDHVCRCSGCCFRCSRNFNFSAYRNLDHFCSCGTFQSSRFLCSHSSEPYLSACVANRRPLIPRTTTIFDFFWEQAHAKVSVKTENRLDVKSENRADVKNEIREGVVKKKKIDINGAENKCGGTDSVREECGSIVEEEKCEFSAKNLALKLGEQGNVETTSHSSKLADDPVDTITNLGWTNLQVADDHKNSKLHKCDLGENGERNREVLSCRDSKTKWRDVQHCSCLINEQNDILTNQQGGGSTSELNQPDESNVSLLPSDHHRSCSCRRAVLGDSSAGPVQFLGCYRVYLAKETHQLAEANQEKNLRLREAFGLTDYVDGSAFDPNRKAKEEAAKAQAMATKKYAIVQSSESEEEEQQEEPPAKKKKKKSRGESSSPERREKRRKHKKHRHSRSESRKHKKSKKSKHSKRSEEKSRKRSRRDSSSTSDSDSDSGSDSGVEDKKSSPASAASDRGRNTARKSPPAGRHDSSDSDSARPKKKNGHVPSPQQSKPAPRNRSRSLSYSPMHRPSPPNHTHTNGRSKVAEKKPEARARSPTPPPKVTQPAKNYNGVDSSKRSPRRSRSHSRLRKSRSSERRRGHSSRSLSRSYSRSRSRSYSRNRNSRSPSIRRRRGSPSHLDKRRITRSRTRSRSRKRSTKNRGGGGRRSRSRSYSRRGARRSRSYSRSRSRSYSRSPNYSSSRRQRARY